jgi:thioredoxin reductase (NADPH)
MHSLLLSSSTDTTSASAVESSIPPAGHKADVDLVGTVSQSPSSNGPSAGPNPVVERDVVIIGSGPSGCTAAIYAGRAMLSPLVIAGYQAGGQLMLTSDVENFPGYRLPISGPDMMDDLMVQATRFGAEFWRVNCQSVDLSQYPYRLSLPNCTVTAKAIIISTGAEALWLGASGEEEFKGKGISTCATCDGYMFRNKPVVVIGGGDSAMEEASFLTRFASSVTVIHRSENFRASKVMLQRAQDNPKITFLRNKRLLEWQGVNNILSGASYEDCLTGVRETVS